MELTDLMKIAMPHMKVNAGSGLNLLLFPVTHT